MASSRLVDTQFRPEDSGRCRPRLLTKVVRWACGGWEARQFVWVLARSDRMDDLRPLGVKERVRDESNEEHPLRRREGGA